MSDAVEFPPARGDGRPSLTAAEARRVARALFGVDGAAQELPSYQDQNFRVADEWVLKIANANTPLVALEAENAAMRHLQAALPQLRFPAPRPSLGGEDLPGLPTHGGALHRVRLLRWVPGTPLAETPPGARPGPGPVGAHVAEITRALTEFDHPGCHRYLAWDLLQGPEVVERGSALLTDPALRTLVRDELTRFQAHTQPLLPSLPRGVAHNDLNDHNLLVGSERNLIGVIDLGDLVHSLRVADLVIAATYLLLETPDPVGVLAQMLEGYGRSLVPTELERELLLPLIRLRMCVSIAMAALAADAGERNDDYLVVSQAGVRRTLATLTLLDDRRVFRRLSGEASRPARPTRARGAIERARTQVAGKALSLSYRRPLHIVRGRGAFLYDPEGRAWLDCVNNVAHVGHEHPRVVEALSEQASLLNTNTRYLHELLPRYCERLLERFGPPFEVCYLVCSGSEANELALRMARAVTGAHGVVVLDGAYHGNTSALVEMSPYKYKGRGGRGRPDWVEEAPLPDPYRGRHRGERAGVAYAAAVAEAAERARGGRSGLAAFFAEAILSCGGQIVPPAGFLQQAFHEVRARGGVVVADEVQVGFGRVGSHWWGWEQAGARPDIVTLGKPIGNGHPMGAVVTTRSVADAFANGMEYFNTFGGNPVSCAVGLAVLDVLEEERLREHALGVGERLLHGLADLEGASPHAGQARGRGLFLGLEIVEDRAGRTPDAVRARRLVEWVKEERQILLSTDGPDHNVLKIKPPLPFSAEDGERLLDALRAGLAALP
ncbi:MAG: aminotransferase class III-fold pyridoxal phosphate-dependent enzyme [Gemmatimonadota bacterium]